MLNLEDEVMIKAADFRPYADYLLDIAGRDVQTVTWHIRHLVHFATYAAARGWEFVEIDEPRFREYVRDKKLKLSAENKTCIAMKSYYRYLCRLEILRSNPFDFIAQAKQPEKLRRFYTQPEIEALLRMPNTGKIVGLRDRTMLEILYDTGIRNHEVRQLTLPDVDLERQSLRILCKRRKERLIPVPDMGIAWLKQYLRRRHEMFHAGLAVTDVLFPSFTTGKMMDTSTLWRMVKQYARRAGLGDDFTTHSLRHAFASHMLDNGADLRIVQLMLGHSDIRTTQIYTHVHKNRLKELHRQFHPRGG